MARSKESIDVFKSRITRVQGFARPNLFTVFVRRPGGLQDLLPEVGSQFKFQIKATSLPAANIGTIQIPFNGRMFNVPGDRTYEPLSMTVMNDEKFDVREFFEKWIDLVQHRKFNYARGGNMSYFSTVDVAAHQRDARAGGSLADARRYRFVNCFPTNVSSIDLDAASNDAIEEFSVEWQYSHYRVIDSKSPQEK